jgi:hypothetical protein
MEVPGHACDRDFERRYHRGLWCGIVLAFDLCGAAADARSARLRLGAAEAGAAELAAGVPPRARTAASRVVLRGLGRHGMPVRSPAFDRGMHAGVSIALAVAEDLSNVDAIRDELDQVGDIVAMLYAGPPTPSGAALTATIRHELARRRQALETYVFAVGVHDGPCIEGVGYAQATLADHNFQTHPEL